ncbi:pseudouridine synthase [Aquirufa antheringensis]|jgi:23S rRNA pseudouridine2605 synthase|uniref:Pseudouridine synthase n=1 Tax=Aquirufa antheringensis TaxID=2516559 RepID=A0A4V2IWC0_9BACT|nr:pseudouridine synthase [Aquirufa antheringensis]MCZ2485214.1 pseudouridine synthase [Aquirufa antheringensis]MCZ2487399.1 pseudouridine synthase [Aquirufa antheringensis]MCZ2490363.1 pseudouridine synthase [Aquirufa antheringensis]TBH75515.1 pseudouridine synthase [Aquirufa antheringensis]
MRKRISNDDNRRDSRPTEGRASTGRSGSRSDSPREFRGPRNDSGAPRNDSGAPRAPRSESSNRFSGDRKPFNREGGERKPFNRDNREGGERRSFGDRKPFDGERKPYQGGGERKPYQGGERKPFNRDNREGGERRSFGDRKPFDGERKPYQGGGERKPYQGGERKPFGRTENPTRTPYKGDNRWDRNAAPKVEGSEESTKPLDENPTARIERRYEERTERFADREERPEGARNPRYSDRETFKSRSRFDAGPAYEPQYKLDRYKERAPAKIQKKIAQTDRRSDVIRLNRYIANAGICSRRDADKLIEAGEIKVNNKVVTEMGYQVNPTDIVKYGNRKLNREKPVYLLLNKPKDFLTTTEDPNDRKTVMELVKNATESRIYPVGRLDRNTTGLLLITNDGELADKLTHPSNEIEKIYQAELDKPLTDEDFEKIKEGLTLEDGEIKVDDLAKVTPDGYVIGVKIHSGKNRIVRRIFEHLGYEVTKLDRTTFAGLTKKDLPRGSWRFLTERELVKLKYLM